MGESVSRPYQRSLRNYLLDPRYQLRFALFMVLIAALLMTGLGVLVMRRAESDTDVGRNVLLGQLITLGAESVEVEIAALVAKKQTLAFVLLGIGVSLSVGLFAYGITMTHHVAGPLHKIGSYLDRVRDEKFARVFPLRQGDQLQGFYEHFREMHDAVRARQETDVVRLRAFLAAVRRDGLDARSPELADGLAKLDALVARKEQSLG
ncbi:MAG: hypothetical protein EXR73_08985 [Myxococcales bacterium]|nr:hypothetical protein [Myxococcales bacterium]